VRAYYEGRTGGLGDRFITALEACYAELRLNPFFAMRKPPYRYRMLHKFPYRVIYEVKGQDVVVYQVRYAARRSTKKFGP
jgi:hypothetical protein